MTKRIDINRGKLEKMYIDERMTTIQIAEKLKLSQTCICNNLKRNDIPRRNKREKYWKKDDLELHKKGKWQCLKCRQVKNISEFTPVEKYWMGHSYMCRECNTKRRIEWRKNNPWKNKTYYINKRVGFNFVTSDDLKNIWDKYKGRCYYCDRKLDYRTGFNGLHIEHVVNGLHKVENLVLSCPRCNNIKKDATADELENIAKKMRDFSAT